MIKVKMKGDWGKTDRYFGKVLRALKLTDLDRYGRKGVDALSRATPVDTGLTASSWYYVIDRNRDGATISWHNSNVNKGVNIALILQYGHGTRRGAYVRGVDYINPALKPIFDQMADEAWKEVTDA